MIEPRGGVGGFVLTSLAQLLSDIPSQLQGGYTHLLSQGHCLENR